MELRDIIRALTRRFWLLMLGAALAMLGSYLAFRYFTVWPRYQASVTAILGNSNLNSDWASLQANRELLTTYAQWATRRPVLEGVLDVVHLPMSAEDLRGRIDAHLVGNTQMIEITVRHDGPLGAAMIANETMRQLEIQIRTALADDYSLPSPSREQILELQERIESTEAELSTLTDLLLETDSTEEAELLSTRITALSSYLEMWQRQYADARAEFANRSEIRLIVVEEAKVPAQATNPVLNVLIAGMAGLAATTGAVLLLETQCPSPYYRDSPGLIARWLEGITRGLSRLRDRIKRRFASLKRNYEA